MSRGAKWKAALAAGASLVSAALVCVAQPVSADAPAAWSAADPLEPLNRGLYAIHRGLERFIIRPVLYVFTFAAPKPVQLGLHNVLRNLGEPVTAVNDLLQLRVGRAASATGRFVSNSTLGLLGLFDVASDQGLAYHSTDFGQTLQRYGVPTGPYLFIPVIGPSSVRDAGARFVNGAIDPVGHFHFRGDDTVGTGRTLLSTAETEAQLQANGPKGPDPYADQRTAYLDQRSAPYRYARAAPPPQPAVAPAPEAERPAETERRMVFASVSATFFRPLD